MTAMRDFIKNNKEEIDKAIRQALGRPEAKLNDGDRREWILNDEGLYLWAKREGVRI